MRTVQTTAVLSGLVPYGLFFLVAVAYTVGAAKSSDRGALVQRVNAVESVSNVDVVCVDKTGTLTTGRLSVVEVDPLGEHGVAAVERLVGSMARSAQAPNLTTTALAARAARDDVDRARRGAVLLLAAVERLRTDDGVWVLGAPDALAPPAARPVAGRPGRRLTAQGLRVLVLARAVDPARAVARRERAPRPPGTRAGRRSWSLADELRPGVDRDAGRVRAAAASRSRSSPATTPTPSPRSPRRPGSARPRDRCTAPTLDGLSDPELDSAVADATVFGRIAPEQKERIVASLRRQGRYVAMVGDGVNDARALKRAQVGVAMRSGSAVTRDVADIVLTDDSLAALLPARQEGRRIINGIATSMQLFLARVGTQGLVILAVTMLGLGFPYSPSQVGLTLLTVGVPTLFLTTWARPTTPDPHLLGSLARFVIPAAVVTAAAGVGVYASLYERVLHGFSSANLPAGIIAEFESYTGALLRRQRLRRGLGHHRRPDRPVDLRVARLVRPDPVPAAAHAVLRLVDPADARPAAHRARRRPGPGARRGAVRAGALGLLRAHPRRGAGVPAVLPALVIWFVLLSAAYRFRVLDRSLGLDDLPADGRSL